jgi:hypothetical protein
MDRNADSFVRNTDLHPAPTLPLRPTDENAMPLQPQTSQLRVNRLGAHVFPNAGSRVAVGFLDDSRNYGSAVYSTAPKLDL